MKKDRINIWPSSILYIILFFGIAGPFILVLAIFPFWVLIANEPFDLFDLIPLNTGLIQFIVFFPIAIIGCYMYIKAILFKVSFTETHLIVPKISEVQEKKIKIECNQILTCETSMEGFYYFFAFRCEDGKKRKMFIARFSFKQLKRILKLIKERGGLQDQDIDDIIDPLRIRKKKKSIKRN